MPRIFKSGFVERVRRAADALDRGIESLELSESNERVWGSWSMKYVMISMKTSICGVVVKLGCEV
jgi:hypothetical protein